jgi:hypothetical protein
MAKLANTTKTILGIAFTVVNLERILFFKKINSFVESFLLAESKKT